MLVFSRLSSFAHQRDKLELFINSRILNDHGYNHQLGYYLDVYDDL
jgi:hypothetical protein